MKLPVILLGPIKKQIRPWSRHIEWNILECWSPIAFHCLLFFQFPFFRLILRGLTDYHLPTIISFHFTICFVKLRSWQNVKLEENLTCTGHSWHTSKHAESQVKSTSELYKQWSEFTVKGTDQEKIKGNFHKVVSSFQKVNWLKEGKEQFLSGWLKKINRVKSKNLYQVWSQYANMMLGFKYSQNLRNSTKTEVWFWPKKRRNFTGHLHIVSVL